MIMIGVACVVLGGLVAAVTGPLDLRHGSWLAAYLVLVCGTAQVVVGWMQSGSSSVTPATPLVRGWVQVACLNLGNAAVIGGTLTRAPWMVDGGALLLVVALGIAFHAVRPGTVSSRVAGGLLWAYRGLLLLLVVSLPIGSVLAHIRAE